MTSLISSSKVRNSYQLSKANKLNDPNPIYGIRLVAEQKAAYKSACAKLGVSHPDMLREMIDALIEGRLKIVVPKTQLKIIKGIHHVERT